jgi:hypothetical protein
MEIRLKRVPFNIELAKKITYGKIKGAKIMTGYGQPVRILCFDLKCSYPIAVAVLHNNGQESICTFTEKGYFLNLLKGDKDDICLYVPTYYRDYSNFVPQKWQPCLVRDCDDEPWNVLACAGKNTDGDVLFYGPGRQKYTWGDVLPLSKVTERLIGTTKSYEQLIKELDKNGQD